MRRIGDESEAQATMWRGLLIALCCVTLAIGTIGLVAPFFTRGQTPESVQASYAATADPFVLRVVSAPAASLLRKGDRIDFGEASAEMRYRHYSARTYVVGEHLVFPVLRDGRHLEISATVTQALPLATFFRPARSVYWLARVGVFVNVLVALVLSLRRSKSVEVRILVGVLLGDAMLIFGWPVNWTTPWLDLDVAIAGVSFASGGCVFALTAWFASLFGRPLSLVRRILAAVLVLAAIVNVAMTEVAELLPLGSRVDSDLFSPAYYIVSFAVPYFAAVLVLVTAAAAARGRERPFAIWASSSLAAYFTFAGVASVLESLFPETAPRFYPVDEVGGLICTLVLAYALLSRRLIDVGFVLNRATVFATLSLIVFGTFNFAEWTLGGWLATLNRTANAALSAALALGLALALKPIHDAVEHLVDRFMFRRRYAAERAMRDFAHETAFYSDRSSLAEAACTVLRTHAEASSVVLYSEDDESLGVVDADDPALVNLRAWHHRLDLHTVTSALPGEYAFPLVVRGRLTGTLVTGPKRSGEPYAPGDLDVIERIALAIGVALDGLSRETSASGETSSLAAALLAQLHLLTDAVERLSRRVASVEDGGKNEATTLD